MCGRIVVSRALADELLLRSQEVHVASVLTNEQNENIWLKNKMRMPDGNYITCACRNCRKAEITEWFRPGLITQIGSLIGYYDQGPDNSDAACGADCSFDAGKRGDCNWVFDGP